MKAYLHSYLVAVLLLPGSVPPKHFDRVESFPKGANTSVVGSLVGGQGVTEYDFDASLERVWNALQRVTSSPEMTMLRPIVSVDQQRHSVQNGSLTRMALDEKERGGDFVDEFQTRATKLSDAQTRVTISRKLRRKIRGRWGVEKTNGKIERWILSRIEDELQRESVLVISKHRTMESRLDWCALLGATGHSECAG
jgi:hypothetical protein